MITPYTTCRPSRLAAWAVLLSAIAGFSRAPADTILNTKHDLSAVGPGPIKAASESEVCLFCHTPHHAIADTPLWNHVLSTASYTTYESSTARATVGQPTGASKLCLSCHDGTVALGMLNSRAEIVEMASGVVTLPSGRSNLETDLSDDHPVSFTYADAEAGGEFKAASTLTGRVRLDHNGQLQCTACHDPHDNQYGKFLVMANNASALCMACHDKPYWPDTTHRTSTATWNGSGIDPWPNTAGTTVAANGCENCHAPHDAGTGPRLLTRSDEETVCYVCHNGNVVAGNIQAQFTKTCVHPILTTAGVHDPTEDPVNPTTRHAECVDCHNPHASKGTAASVPNASGALAGVTGINDSGALVSPVVREYELCYRCHGDSTDRGPARVTRQTVETNTRLEFSTTSDSYHPIEAVGKNPDVPSMLAPWTKTSRMYCTDCHNNDEGPGAGGAGPAGPHGSAYVPLLERNLETADNTSESAAAYALCYKCHSRTSILGDKSFKEHKKHIDDEKTPCTVCHDPHGVVGTTHLINFDTSVVSPTSSNRLEFVDDGQFRGTCYLKCHDKDHSPLSYSP